MMFASNIAGAKQVADGSRIEFKDRGFSIVPPKGWTVITSVQGASLLMQPNFVPGMRYQRTLQVATFQNARVIDQDNAEAFGDSLVERYANRSSNLSGYRIRNFIPVNLKDGNSGMLYYAEFKIDGVDLMQSHLVVSSRTRHYIISFTDVAEHFEGESETSKFLSTAWESMISFQVDEKPAMRLSPGMKAAMATAVSLIMIGFFAFLRYRRDRATKKYDQLAADLEHATGDDADAGVTTRRGRAITKTATLVDSQWNSGLNSATPNGDDLDFDDEKVG
jgi:hypothetical protein